jgi:hypothetical protein
MSGGGFHVHGPHDHKPVLYSNIMLRPLPETEVLTMICLYHGMQLSLMTTPGFSSAMSEN